MNNENNINVNNVQSSINNSNVQTTNLPQSQVVNNTINNVSQPSTNSNNTNNQKDGCFKYLLAFIFLIGMILLVIFLPQISEYLESRKKGGNTQTENTIQNGTLVCTKQSKSDTTDISHEMKLTFSNKKITYIKLNVETQSSDTKSLEEKKTKCDTASKIAEKINGLQSSCSLVDTVLTVIENYDLKQIDVNNLTEYTAAGGTYPEFKFGKDIYDIQTTLVKEGYNCSVKTSVNQD